VGVAHFVERNAVSQVDEAGGEASGPAPPPGRKCDTPAMMALDTPASAPNNRSVVQARWFGATYSFASESFLTII